MRSPMRTVVIQSYRPDDVPHWISTCLNSVQSWSRAQGFDYRLVGDEIFERVPDWYRDKTSAHPQIATDLGRLHLIEDALEEGYERALWLDADVLVFAPDSFTVEQISGFAFGHEIWVQNDANANPRVHRNVHNAYAVFCRDNAFLPFYQYACEQIIARMEPGPGKGMAPQIVGPKLLTSLNNTLGFDLTHDIAMLSPAVLHDIVHEGGAGASLGLFRTALRDNHVSAPFGANLCASLVSTDHKGDERFMDQVCAALLEDPDILTAARAI